MILAREDGGNLGDKAQGMNVMYASDDLVPRC
ncbi:hypothetical protein EMIT019CA3_40087 [Bacillus pseudomycoides]